MNQKTFKTSALVFATILLFACGETLEEKRERWYLDSKFDYHELDMIARAIPYYSNTHDASLTEPVKIKTLAETAFIKPVIGKGGIANYSVFIADEELVIFDEDGIEKDRLSLGLKELLTASTFDFNAR
ncbi:hypothetical protein BM526_20440 (plasmid) [Alteromonas mediterranea]|uniref:hypothetical protein n=1 Tax=Alteromonas mediterranea TaxID=314275 RepID=UPI000903BF10|nr:hypothetical protein [Alteromonas mediterranea]APE04343.1 hypothetical protein BM526_20440 [Alteromonas mediterranea]